MLLLSSSTGTEMLIDFQELVKFACFFEKDIYLVIRKRFDEIIKGSSFHALNGRLNTCISRHEGHQRRGCLQLAILQNLRAMPIREAYIGKNQIKIIFVDQLLGLGNRIRLSYEKVFSLKKLGEVFPDDCLVFQNNDLFNSHVRWEHSGRMLLVGFECITWPILG